MINSSHNSLFIFEIHSVLLLSFELKRCNVAEKRGQPLLLHDTEDLVSCAGMAQCNRKFGRRHRFNSVSDGFQ